MFYKICNILKVKIVAFFLIVFCLFPVSLAAADFLTYEELITLFDEENLPPELEKKLNLLLTTPFVENTYNANGPLSMSQSDQLGQFLRVAHWNVQQGQEFETLEALFKSNEDFEKLLPPERFPVGSRKRKEVLEQAHALRSADVIVLNEVDWGMKRTNYRNVTAELAKLLKMNYAFGVQFIELTPVHLSRKAVTDKSEKEMSEFAKVDPERYKGLHGMAILSRFPLQNVRFAPFKTQPYDWYRTEKKGTSLLENGKRKLMKTVFLEEFFSEVRRGGRSTLLADIVDPRLPAGRVTIAATHLENRTKPKFRVKQLEELLDAVKEIRNPVVLSGDMNTSDGDATPTSIGHELRKRYGDPKYLIQTVANYALGIGFIENTFFGGLTIGRNWADPTVRDIPFISPNPARKFFTTLKNFRFADGGSFDFRGEAKRSFNNREKTLANSNQRGDKGFVTTYEVNRTVLIFGKFKLDWIFVKPANLKNPTDNKESHQFAPHFGRTLGLINKVIKDNISDHHPMIVDLPLGDPAW
jgi:endonuclease/exonuclease/phosphatase family metal-dependent hydrolase